MSIMGQLINLLAEAIETGNVAKVEQEVRELAEWCAAQKVPITLTLERIRGMRRLILSRCSDYVSTFIQTLEEWHQYYEIEREIGDYVDTMYHAFIDTYLNEQKCRRNGEADNIPVDHQKIQEEMSKREALAAVGQLAAGMAHEIRNPLTSIKGFIQLLREQTSSDVTEPYFSVILTEIERIDGLLNDVLVLARYRDDNLVPERFQVMEEVCAVIRLLEPESNRRGIRIELTNNTSDLYVYGYRPRIKQAILNILKNSLEAMVSKGSLVQVTVEATVDQAVITVEDDGPGLSSEVKKNLFVPFFTTKQDGTGLGLSTTQRIVIDHGGEIFADNSPQLGGARFEVRLPISLP
jgi:signal transduction histidine kinase